MRYNIVAGEELKKIMSGTLENPIPFNEDMSKGDFNHPPFSKEFLIERATTHNINVTTYKNKLSEFLEVIQKLNNGDTVHLYFGEDSVCVANRSFLVEFLKPEVKTIVLHIVDEYTGKILKDILI